MITIFAKHQFAQAQRIIELYEELKNKQNIRFIILFFVTYTFHCNKTQFFKHSIIIHEFALQNIKQEDAKLMN